jgi:hypothetical protein
LAAPERLTSAAATPAVATKAVVAIRRLLVHKSAA